MGYRVKFHASRKVITRESGQKMAYGYILPKEGIIGVGRIKPNGKKMSEEDIIFVLAHELRHAIHKMDDLFISYYDRRYGVPSPSYGLLAETDCDDFAKNYLRERGIGRSSFCSRKYSTKKVLGYYYWKIKEEFGSPYASMYWDYGESGYKMAKKLYKANQRLKKLKRAKVLKGKSDKELKEAV